MITLPLEAAEDDGWGHPQHDDHLGSVDTFTDQQGLVNKITCDVFGTRTPSQSFDVRRGFTFHSHDDDISVQADDPGLIDMRGRVYDPKIGRFATADPISSPMFSQRQNRYAYALNNPLAYVEPSGFDCAAASSGGPGFPPSGCSTRAEARARLGGHGSGGSRPGGGAGGGGGNKVGEGGSGPKGPGGGPSMGWNGPGGPGGGGPGPDGGRDGFPSGGPSGVTGPVSGSDGPRQAQMGGGGYSPSNGPYGSSFGYSLTHSNFFGSGLFQTGWGDRALQIAQNTSLAVGLAAGAAVGSYYAYAGVYASGGCGGVFSAAGAKGVGGAISGGLGQLVAGSGWRAGGRGALVGGVVGAVNPFGGLGGFGMYGGIGGASLNSGLGNIINQFLSGSGAGSAPVSTGSAGASVFGRAIFGLASLGVGSTSLAGNIGLGLAGGFAGGGASLVASSAGLGNVAVVFIAP